ncbi:MAG: DUF6908 domain-containing protein [Desulfovibrionales bacterium]
MPPKEEVYKRIYDKMNRVLNRLEGARTVFSSQGEPSLVVEHVEHDSYRIGQYFEPASGERLALPEMLVRVDSAAGRAEALYYRHDTLGVFNEVYYQDKGEFLTDIKEQNQQNRFLDQWLTNLEQTGYFR